MTWGPYFMYYRCPACQKLFKYDLALLEQAGNTFGTCPACGMPGRLCCEGACIPDDSMYEEVE